MITSPQESTPWYRSVAGILGLSVLLPPAGLALVWLKREFSTKTKILATVAIVLLGAGYIFLFTSWRSSREADLQYARLEQHRAQQQNQPGAPATDPNAAAVNPAQQRCPALVFSQANQAL